MMPPMNSRDSRPLATTASSRGPSSPRGRQKLSCALPLLGVLGGCGTQTPVSTGTEPSGGASQTNATLTATAPGGNSPASIATSSQSLTSAGATDTETQQSAVASPPASASSSSDTSLPSAESASTESASTEGERSTSTAVSDAGPPLPPLSLDIGQVWSGHPVNFALLTGATHQYVAYYAADQTLEVASRELGSETWTRQTLPTSVGWDSHNHIALGLDEEGQLHVSGNMHNVPLIYFRTSSPGNVASLERVDAMLGSNEQSVTYPEFFRSPSGALAFAYRDGGSGNGDHIFNQFDVASHQWHRLLDTPLTDGEGQRNAYPVGPVQGPDGYWHLVWVWRDTPDADTNHDLSYARTRDLVHWESGDTQLQLVTPITLGEADIVDPIPVDAGLINNNTKVGFDAEQRPVIVYHKYDNNGKTQLFNARVEDRAWVVHQTSNWDYRWEFGGEGTLVFEIEVEGVVVQPDGRLTQTFYHSQYGGWGAFELDPVTLEAVRTIEPPLPYPPELDRPESNTAGMKVRWAKDWSHTTSDYTYMLRWETLDSNRDMPRSPVPPATTLRLYGFPR